MVKEQSKICTFFQTVQCENEEHQKCEEVYGSTELNLEARCSCGCHIEENGIKIVPDSRDTRAREHIASVGKKQMTLDEIGVATIVKERNDR